MLFTKIAIRATTLTLLIMIGLIGCQPGMVKLFQSGSVKQKHFKTAVPFQYRSTLMMVEVKLNGSNETYQFLFDTGAPTVISKTLVEKLGLTSVGQIKVSDSQQNKQQSQNVMLKSIQVGNIEFNDILAVALDMEATVEVGCLGMDGIIGGNLMRQAIWEIDYEQQQLVMTSSLDSLNMAVAHLTLPFQAKLTGTPVLPCTIGDKPVNITFDTGKSSEHISLASKNFRYIAKDTTIQGFGKGSTGMFGSSEDTLYTSKISQFKTGDLLLPHTVVTSNKVSSSLLGNGFLREYCTQVVMDWNTHQLFLFPRTTPSTQNHFKSYGFGPAYDGEKLYVANIYENSPAARANIALGDQILAVNEIDYSNITLDQYCELMLNKDSMFNGQPLEIKVLKADGPMVTRVEKADLFKQ